MQYLDLTLSSLAENLALDEALLNEADSGEFRGEVLRFWESPDIAVVIGRGTKLNQEVNVPACEQDGVPVLRRCSGGTSVVIGPGCLMYAVLISYESKPHLRSVDAAHEYVMGRMRDALVGLQPVDFRGSCDLTIVDSTDPDLSDRKFSGNALRCKRDYFLYHGTFLYDYRLELISKYLLTPPREPEYRNQRSHNKFLANFGHPPAEIKEAIRRTWNITSVLPEQLIPMQATRELVEQRYSENDWHRR